MISIIGAGPVGCYAAKLLAKAGKEVQVFEEHKQIGKPVQCTGIVTQSLADVVRLRNEFVVNRLKKARLHSPDGNSVEINTRDVVIDRTRFDRYIAEQAKKAGANIFLDNKITGIKNSNDKKKLRIKNARRKNAKIIETDILIGADGPKSLVSRFIGNKIPQFWVGLQASVKMRVERNTYDVYFGKEFPGFFGWVVPESETSARVGIATAKKPKQIFNRFIKRFERCKIIGMQGGLIPRYDSRFMVEQDGTYIVGDAATQVKATTGGGLVPGLRAAECLAKAIHDDADYKKELKSVDKELKMSLMIRNLLDRFNETDYNRLIKTVSNEKIKKLLNKQDRDRPSGMVFKSIIKEPKLLIFAQTLFRAKRL